jgi:hypothetical protein
LTINKEKVFMKFDVSQVPSTASVESAILRFWTSTIDATCMTVVYKVTSSWDKTTIAIATNEPTTGSVYASGNDAAGENGYNITTLVREWVTGVSTNNGMMIFPYDGSATTLSNLARMYDHDDPNFYPRIDIKYTQ